MNDGVMVAVCVGVKVAGCVKVGMVLGRGEGLTDGDAVVVWEGMLVAGGVRAAVSVGVNDGSETAQAVSARNMRTGKIDTIFTGIGEL